jgi:hypothetical protein
MWIRWIGIRIRIRIRNTATYWQLASQNQLFLFFAILPFSKSCSVDRDGDTANYVEINWRHTGPVLVQNPTQLESLQQMATVFLLGIRNHVNILRVRIRGSLNLNYGYGGHFIYDGSYVHN